MTDSLRMRVVEAGARALHEHVAKREGWSNKAFNAIPEVAREVYREWSAEMLGVYLDCLTENADEWDRETHDRIVLHDERWWGAALAVLREPTDG